MGRILNHRTRPVVYKGVVATVIREWIVPGVATAMVAWIVIPTRAAVSDTYAINAVVEHRECALEEAPPPRGESVSYSADDFAALIPDFGGRMHVVKAHGYAHSIAFTHVIVEEDGGPRASIVMARAPRLAQGYARTPAALVPTARRHRNQLISPALH